MRGKNLRDQFTLAGIVWRALRGEHLVARPIEPMCYTTQHSWKCLYQVYVGVRKVHPLVEFRIQREQCGFSSGCGMLNEPLTLSQIFKCAFILHVLSACGEGIFPLKDTEEGHLVPVHPQWEFHPHFRQWAEHNPSRVGLHQDCPQHHLYS